MKKCETCIWETKVNGRISLCLFSRCVKDEGWLTDKDSRKEEKK